MRNRLWQPRPGTPLNRNDSLARDLVLAPIVLGGNKVWDPTGQSWSVVTGSGAPTGTPGQSGNAIRFVEANASYLQNTTAALPTAGCTVLMLVKVRNSGSTGSAFGESLSSGSTNRLQAHVPYAGTIYWDYLNTALGRISYTPSSDYWGVWHRMAFRVGAAQGMSIWEDGRIKASSGAAPNRSASTGFYLGAGNTLTNDNDVEALWLYNRELTNAEILRWTLNPYAMFTQRRDVYYAPPAAAPTGVKVPWHLLLGRAC